MYRVNRIMVGLDLSYMDDKVIPYAFNIGRIVKANRMFFAFFTGNNWSKQLGQIDKSASSFLEAQTHFSHYFKAKIDQYKPEDCTAETIVQIQEGDPLTQILALSKTHNIDLIAVGRKSTSPHAHLLTKRLVRRALCSVLCITENPRQEIRKILVPISYDRYAKYAIERATEFVHDHPEVELVCFNAYQVPMGYHAVGRSREEFAEILRDQSEKRFEHFIAKVDTQDVVLNKRFALSKSSNPADGIHQAALIEHADLIVMGSRGRTAIAARFISSTAEKLSLLSVNIPLLVLKDRHTNLDFFEALRRL